MKLIAFLVAAFVLFTTLALGAPTGNTESVKIAEEFTSVFARENDIFKRACANNSRCGIYNINRHPVVGPGNSVNFGVGNCQPFPENVYAIYVEHCNCSLSVNCGSWEVARMELCENPRYMQSFRTKPKFMSCSRR